MRDLVGKHPNFKLGAPVANGAYGVIYACYESTESTSPEIALKLFIDDDLPQDVVRELTMLQKLKGQHQNIINIIEIETYAHLGKKHIGITMPFYTTNLCPAIYRHEIVYNRIMETVQESFDGLIDAIKHLHSHCIIHRDIKAENVLVNDNRLILSDFGSATFCRPEQTLKFRGEKKKGGKIDPHFGTELHYAPEVLRGNYGPPADIWSLGVTIYQFNIHDLIEADSEEEAIKMLSRLSGNIHRDIPYRNFFEIDPAKRHKLASGIIGGGEFDVNKFAEHLRTETGKPAKICKTLAEKIFDPSEKKSETAEAELEIIEMLKFQLVI